MSATSTTIVLGLLSAAAVTGVAVYTGSANASVITSSASSKVAACRTAETRMTITAQSDLIGFSPKMGLVALTNVSKRACWVEGHAFVALIDAADNRVDVPTSAVKEPGKAVHITLGPNRTAFEGIKWTPCDKGNETCGVGNTLEFSLETSSGDGKVAKLEGFRAPEGNNLTMSSLKIGTLQPITAGVVAW